MSYASMVRNGVKLADKMTKSFQVTVKHRAWIGQSTDGYGTPKYANAVSRLAIVEYDQKPVLTLSGMEVNTYAYVCFVRPLEPNGTVGRVEPVDKRDLITFPDGTTGPIIDVKNFLDPKTNRGYLTEVWVGDPRFDDRMTR